MTEGGKFPNEIKLILVGESGTGKTNLITVSIGGKFDINSKSSTAPSFVHKPINLGFMTYNVYLWDTLGNEAFRSLTRIFMKGSKIVIFVYDITDKHSFNELPFWVGKIEEVLGKDPIIGVVGNKIDLVNQEEVTEEEGKKYAESIKAKFRLTSAKEDAEGFVEFIEELVKAYHEKYGDKRAGSITSKVYLDKSKHKKSKKKKNCC